MAGGHSLTLRFPVETPGFDAPLLERIGRHVRVALAPSAPISGVGGWWHGPGWSFSFHGPSPRRGSLPQLDPAVGRPVGGQSVACALAAKVP